MPHPKETMNHTDKSVAKTCRFLRQYAWRRSVISGFMIWNHSTCFLGFPQGEKGGSSFGGSIFDYFLNILKDNHLSIES